MVPVAASAGAAAARTRAAVIAATERIAGHTRVRRTWLPMRRLLSGDGLPAIAPSGVGTPFGGRYGGPPPGAGRAGADPGGGWSFAYARDTSGRGGRRSRYVRASTSRL